jgi:hypothetical protein
VTYVPTTVVTIGSDIVTGFVVDTYEITNGRTSIQDQPYPITLSMRLYGDDDVYWPYNIQDPILVTLDGSPVFRGDITDLTVTLNGSVPGSRIQYIDVSAMGPLSKLSRKVMGVHTYPQQGDGTRIAAIIADANSLTWDEYPTYWTWANQDPTVQWTTAGVLDYGDPSRVDQPGDYTVSALAAGTYTALDACQDAAQSGRGILWDSPLFGWIHYESFAQRNTPVNTVALTGDYIMLDGMQRTLSTSDIVTQAQVNYTGGTAVVSEDPFAYGLFTGVRDTSLAFAGDALTQAQSFADARSSPVSYPTEIRLALHLESANAVRPYLIQFDPTTKLTYAAGVFPVSIYPYPLECFTEGATLQVSNTEVYMTITQSITTMTYPHPSWFQVPYNLDWVSYTASTQWKDA